ncbi:MAG TPA: hypothetical protein VM033_04265 [Gemmatimonadaceae bacterium]|nr:hypothetical protein [Gemmatimonadaceae bacterium]
MPDRWQLLRASTAALLLAMAWPSALAQCDTSAGSPIQLTGQVIDARAHVPVPARVLLTAARDTLATLDADAAGYFSAVVCRRAVIMAHFRRLGYRPDSLAIPLDSARPAPLDVAMTPMRATPATGLAESQVAMPRTSTAIRARARRGGGMFLGLEEIEAAQASRTTELLRGRRGIALEDVNGALRIVSARSGRPRATVGTPAPITDESTARVQVVTESCPLRVGVDDRLMAEDYRVDDLVPTEVAAIEIYPSSASMPVEFTVIRHSKTCGLVMFWTRDGVQAP